MTALQEIPEENCCFPDRAFAMIGRNYMTLERRRLLLPARVMAIMMVGATEDANAYFFPEP
jgi:hypothetical protein